MNCLNRSKTLAAPKLQNNYVSTYGSNHLEMVITVLQYTGCAMHNVYVILTGI